MSGFPYDRDTPTEARRYPRWHVCHHCRGARCEVCEEQGGWFESAAQRQGRLLMWRAGRSEDARRFGGREQP